MDETICQLIRLYVAVMLIWFAFIMYELYDNRRERLKFNGKVIRLDRVKQ